MTRIGSLSQPQPNKRQPAWRAMFARVAIMAAAASLLGACDLIKPILDARKAAPNAEPKVQMTLHRLAFKDLGGWTSDNHAAALASFKTSCVVITGRDKTRAMGGNKAYGTAGDWRAVCAKAVATPPAKARAFFETNFTPFETRADGETKGIFTGYYEPELSGSRHRTEKHKTPLYARPNDLIMVDLGEFRDTLKGERISGRVIDGKLKPYAKREEIVAKGLGAASNPIVYIDDAFEAFSIQIQGSGRVRLADGTLLRLNYDGQNGHAYVAIGRKLIDRGAIKRENLSMQSIKAWLTANPKQADAVMNLNPSYVFFKEDPIGDPAMGAPGAMTVPLSPERSLAIDLRFHALGAPLWVDATRPADKEGEDPYVFQHLLIAHDTGGAIRGPVRGDVYWGAGARAAELAGRMANRGRLIVLLPKPLAGRVAAAK